MQYGPCVLREKHTATMGTLYDLTVDHAHHQGSAQVTRGVVYGVLGSTRVRILRHSRSDSKRAPRKSAGT